MSNLTSLIDYIESLYESYDLFSSSMNGRENFSKDQDRQLIYGEIKLHEIAKAFDFLDLDSEYRFIDYGSGAGKIVLLANHLNIFRQCVGIELVTTLYEISEEVKSVYLNSTNSINKIAYFNRNFLHLNLNQIKCCIYTNSICFSLETCDQMALKFNHMVTGSYIISTKHLTLGENFSDVVHLDSIEASWGESSLFIYQKIK
ncbi:hypothetical protein DID73_01675 [Candidatus Marinamargulisbacteria bacterium SCGC AG-343-K17]|nr:hypothetical protein DID73_01675 [Candidatus Marinamargulisbacteria bacterium SCGC AG-343-K17]